MHGPDWQIGRILGIPIKVHASWFLVFLFVTWTLATGYLPSVLPGHSAVRYWAMGGVSATLLFASVLLHELGHSYVALCYRIPIGQITLFIFGGVAQMRREPPGPRAEFLIAIAGPLVSFLLGGLCFGLVSLAESVPGSGRFQGLLVLAVMVGHTNFLLGVFNLIPGFPLDGGRVLRASLWAWTKDFYRATSHASLAGLWFGGLLALLGGLMVFAAVAGALPGTLVTNGGWIVLIGAFLFTAARGSRRQAALKAILSSVAVRDLMVCAVTTIDPRLTVEDAVNGWFLRYGYGGFPVVQDSRPVGMVTVREIRTVPPSLWAWRRVQDVMRPWTPDMAVAPDCSVVQALERMVQTGEDRLVVVDDGRLVGLVTRSAVARYLQLRGFQS